MLKTVGARRPKTRYQLTMMDTLSVVAARKLFYKMFDRGIRLEMHIAERALNRRNSHKRGLVQHD